MKRDKTLEMYKFICPVCHTERIFDKKYNFMYCPFCGLDFEMYESGHKRITSEGVSRC